MDIVRYTDKFFALERDLRLFSERIDGIAWWDGVRYEVFHLVYYNLAELHLQAPSGRPLFKRIGGYAARLGLKAALRVKMLIRRYDVVVFRCPRHEEGGKRIDVVMDQIMTATPGRKLVINTSPTYYHRGIRSRGRTRIKRPPVLDALAQAIEREFKVPAGFEDFVLDHIGRFIASVDAYERLFRTISPRLVIMIQNGVEKGMFCAARSLKVPVIEVQHGLIQYVHAGYSYPPDLSYGHITSFPSHFFAFSRYWIESCHYPALHHAVVGNDHYFVEHRPAQKDDVLFVSSYVHDRVLRQWIKAVASRLPQRAFKYKLHPNQRGQEAEIRAALSSVANIEVIGTLTKIRDLLPLTSVVVLIQSTVAHEALQAGRTVCILPFFDYQTHADLLVLPQVFVPRTEDELARIIASPRPEAPAPVFFERFDDTETRQLIASILQGAAGARPAGANQNAFDAGTD